MAKRSVQREHFVFEQVERGQLVHFPFRPAKVVVDKSSTTKNRKQCGHFDHIVQMNTAPTLSWEQDQIKGGNRIERH
jgi:hypothetical protein